MSPTDPSFRGSRAFPGGFLGLFLLISFSRISKLQVEFQSTKLRCTGKTLTYFRVTQFPCQSPIFTGGGECMPVGSGSPFSRPVSGLHLTHLLSSKALLPHPSGAPCHGTLRPQYGVHSGCVTLRSLGRWSRTQRTAWNTLASSVSKAMLGPPR